MFKVGFSYFQGRFLLTDFYPWELTGMSIGVYAAAGVGMLLLGLDKVGVYCSWEMMGPPSPALGRSWGKVLLCHKGLGGVFCVSGPNVCQPKGPVYQLEYLLLVQLAFSQSFLVGLPSCTVVPSHSSALLSCILFPLFSTSGAPPSLRPVSPPPFTFLHLAPLSPPFRFLSLTPVTLPSLFLSLHPF